MFPIRVALVSQSSQIDFVALSKAANAINLQVSRDFMPIWGVSATVVALPDEAAITPGLWPVYIVDVVGLNGALGFHLNAHNQPFARVQAGSTWTLTASHEVLEMLADPSGNRLVSATSVEIVDDEVRDGDGKFEYLVEVCDPSEDAANAYLIDSVLVSDFYTPRYFDPVAAVAVRYSYSGKIRRPRQLLPNGYLSWINPITQTLQQARAFGAPEIIDRGPIELSPGAGPSSSLRGTVDKLTTPPVDLSNLATGISIVQRRENRSAFLAEADALRAASFSAINREVKLEAIATAMPGGEPVTVPAPPAPTMDARAIAALSVPGVIAARVGRQMVDGWPTGGPAYVVTVKPAAMSEVAYHIPTAIDGVPVDLRPASAIDLLADEDPLRFAVMADARHELRKPSFPDEIKFDEAGQPLPAPADLGVALAAARPGKPHLEYSAPAGVALGAIEDDFTLVLHVSPDAGWPELQRFLAQAAPRLVVGMYDFTSKHILDAVEQALSGHEMILTLDHPAKNGSADQTDEETIDALGHTVTHLSAAWALTNSDPKASDWIYPNAYHIKVAVRDDDTLWLSSGNWNNSNQPEIDPSDLSAALKIAKVHDRDWHVVATNKRLADTFRTYLQHDFTVAAGHQADDAALAAFTAAAPDLPDLSTLELAGELFAAGRTFRKLFPAKTITGRFRVQPLLTPDNYHDHVLDLIRSATARFYMQTQYIHPGSGPNDAKHNELIAAVQKLIDDGVDVRIICSEFETAAWLEKLSATGFDIRVLRVQPKVHNKGIIVDSKTVMVSSQNWSADGTLRNRDAGLIISSEEAAAYYEPIFLHDWENLAAQRAIS